MTKNIFYVKTFIAGAGAAGLAAAISASSDKKNTVEATGYMADVLVADGNDRVGRKLAATGNGKCNFTNVSACEDDYNMPLDGFVRSALEKWGVGDTLDFFRSIGIMARTDEQGRCYPYSERASSVVNVLYSEALRRGCKFMLSDRAASIVRAGDGNFKIMLESGVQIFAENVIIACGGRAGLKTGSTGDGYGFAKGFGHTLAAPRPALTAVESDDDCMPALKGVRAKGNVTLVRYSDPSARSAVADGGEIAGKKRADETSVRGAVMASGEIAGKKRADEASARSAVMASGELVGKKRADEASVRSAVEAVVEIVDEEAGEIQFTGTGLSGICIFDLTRYMRDARPMPKKKSGIKAGVKFGEKTKTKDSKFFYNDSDTQRMENTGNAIKYNIICDFVPDMTEKELYDILKQTKAKTSMKVSEILRGVVNEKLADVIADKSHENLYDAVKLLKFFTLSANHTKGWNEAQTTCGGVSRMEIDSVTMESKLEKGLYFCGEVIDVDGRCGGFNLQWAWTSGMIAGRNAQLRIVGGRRKIENCG